MVESAHNAFSPFPFDWYFDELWIQLLGRNDEPKFSQNTDKSAFGLLPFWTIFIFSAVASEVKLECAVQMDLILFMQLFLYFHGNIVSK